MRLLIAALICLLGLATPAYTAQPTAPVQVTGGTLTGTDTGEVRTYFGIPYAAAPTGALRWRAPQPVTPWTGVKQANAFSPACQQTVTWVSNPRSEDCLYLNIWAPEKAERLPVIVWIHGGGYFGGTGAQGNYDGTRLTKRGVIVITINYRLGVFGFFSHPELSAESPEKTSGNQGIQDQIAALKWVRTNIAAFGGDPDRVTIMGESAGAESVAILVASPPAKGLFQRAIAESGNGAIPLSPAENAPYDRKTAENIGINLGHALGTAHLSDLRAMDAKALLNMPWTPRATVDGYVIREDLTTTYQNHRQNDVPVLVGWNADEGKDLAPEILGTAEFTVATRPALMAKLLMHTPSQALLDAYPVKTDAEAETAINQLTTDWWGWRMWAWTRLQAQHGKAKPYLYYFVHSPVEPLTPCGYGCHAGHGAEIPYVFDLRDQDKRPWSAEDRRISDQLATYWTNFAKTGNPNGAGQPVWPAFDGSNASTLRIGDDSEIKQRGTLPDFELLTPKAE